MQDSERFELIRKGNEAFNRQDYSIAKECFLKAEYGDGLVRLGDYYMYDKRLPLLAYGYYRKANAHEKLTDLHRRMVAALGEWIGKDKIKTDLNQKTSLSTTRSQYVGTDSDGMVRVPVPTQLLKKAKDIIETGST